MNSSRVLMAAALCLGFATACAKSRGPEAGTNTNWLKKCQASAECAGAGDCLCGVCTLSCSDDTTCLEVGASASCTPMSEAECGTQPSGSVCLPPAPARDAGISTTFAPDAGLSLVRVGTEVQVTDRYRACNVDDPCILVGTGCDGCCQQDAIRASAQDAYATNFELACSDYRGAICDCQPQDLVPLCQAGQCRALPRDPARDCYSPTQNATRANVPGATGCACDQAGLSICVSGSALICNQGEDGLRWAAVEDGPCALDPRVCPTPSALRPDSTSCLAEFATCVEAPTGEFCGRDCHGPLECNRPAGCDYRPFDLVDCPTTGGAAGVWEGLCGDVRYRVEGNGYGGPTWFWNAATGALLAVIDATDINAFCNNADTMIVRGDLLTAQTCTIVRDDTTSLCPADPVAACFAAGCVCSRAGLQLCSGGVAMACTESAAGPTWTLREGVPCDEQQTCPEARQRATADTCLAEFRNCDELSDGSFCGGGCHATLDCAAIDCEYKPFDGDCSASKIYEGLCGDVRYRYVGGLGTTTSYWNDASGKLLAMVETSDVGDYCGGGDNVLQHGDLDVISNCQVVMDETTQICP